MAYNQIDQNTFHFSEFPVVVSFAASNTYDNDTKAVAVAVANTKTEKNMMSWGNSNSLCDDREALIKENNIIPQLLKTQRNISLGTGIFCFTEFYEKGKRKIVEVKTPDEIQETFDELDEDDYWENLCNDFVKNSLAYARFKQNSNKKFSIANVLARYIRPTEMNADGIIESFLRCGNWKKKEGVTGINSYHSVKNEPKKHLLFMHRIGDHFLGNEYFPEPIWFTGHKWIEIGNKIPEFHTFNLENQYFTPLHIEIPKGYFYQGHLVKSGKLKESEARQQEADARMLFLQKVDSVLSGTKNAGKAVWSEYSISEMKKEFGGIKFNELKIPRGDDALLALFEKTNEANISGTGVHPSLAAIMSGDSLSSGSEIRNALDMYIITQSLLARRQLLKPLNILKKLNGWDKNIKFGFRDVQLTTTDANPTGSQSVTAQ